MSEFSRNLAFRRQLDRVLGIPLLWAMGMLRRRKQQFPEKINTLVLFQSAAMGDTLLMAGAIRFLRRKFPAARLILALGPNACGVASLFPPVDEIVRIDVLRPLQALRQLRAMKADVFMDYGPWPRINSLLTALSGAKFTIGFSTPGQGRHFAYDRAVEHRRSCHELQNQQRLLELFGPIGDWNIYIDAPAAIPQVSLLSRPYVVFHPWASGSGKRIKEWNTPGWIEVAKWCAARGFSVVITGSKQDIHDTQDLMDVLQKTLPDLDVISVAGKCNLMETAGALSRARAVVSVNTGVMHLSSLLNVPTVGLCGPMSPERWGPLGSKSVALFPTEGLRDYIHLGFEYPPHVKSCMEYISSSAVIDGVSKVLSANVEIS